MKLFELLKKPKVEQRTLKEQKPEELEIVVPEFEGDMAEWHFEMAETVYRTQQNKTAEEELTSEEVEIVWEYAGNHIAYFVTWLVKNNLFIAVDVDGTINVDEVNSGIKKIDFEKITGNDFFTNYCNRKFYKENVAEVARDFVNVYYHGKFKTDYKSFVEMVLGKEVNGLGYTCEEFQRYCGILDIAYANHKLANK